MIMVAMTMIHDENDKKILCLNDCVLMYINDNCVV